MTRSVILSLIGGALFGGLYGLFCAQIFGLGNGPIPFVVWTLFFLIIGIVRQKKTRRLPGLLSNGRFDDAIRLADEMALRAKNRGQVAARYAMLGAEAHSWKGDHEVALARLSRIPDELAHALDPLYSYLLALNLAFLDRDIDRAAQSAQRAAREDRRAALLAAYVEDLRGNPRGADEFVAGFLSGGEDAAPGNSLLDRIEVGFLLGHYYLRRDKREIAKRRFRDVLAAPFPTCFSARAEELLEVEDEGDTNAA